MEPTRTNSNENHEMTEDVDQSFDSSPSKASAFGTPLKSPVSSDPWTHHVSAEATKLLRYGTWNPLQSRTPSQARTPKTTPPMYAELS